MLATRYIQQVNEAEDIQHTKLGSHTTLFKSENWSESCLK